MGGASWRRREGRRREILMVAEDRGEERQRQMKKGSRKTMRLIAPSVDAVVTGGVSRPHAYAPASKDPEKHSKSDATLTPEFGASLTLGPTPLPRSARPRFPPPLGS